MVKEKLYLEWFANKLKVICKIITYLSIIISFSIFIYIICIELFKKTLILDTFDVPKELQEKGYTNKVLLNKLNDQIKKIEEITIPTTTLILLAPRS